jgi:hypothetical protein
MIKWFRRWRWQRRLARAVHFAPLWRAWSSVDVALAVLDPQPDRTMLADPIGHLQAARRDLRAWLDTNGSPPL